MLRVERPSSSRLSRPVRLGETLSRGRGLLHHSPGCAGSALHAPPHHRADRSLRYPAPTLDFATLHEGLDCRTFPPLSFEPSSSCSKASLLALFDGAQGKQATAPSPRSLSLHLDPSMSSITAQHFPPSPTGHTASLIPGLSDDVALLCLARVGIESHHNCRAVNKLWYDTFSSASFRQRRRDLHLMEPTLIVRVAKGSSKAYQWYALIPRAPTALPVELPVGAESRGMEGEEMAARPEQRPLGATGIEEPSTCTEESNQPAESRDRRETVDEADPSCRPSQGRDSGLEQSGASSTECHVTGQRDRGGPEVLGTRSRQDWVGEGPPRLMPLQLADPPLEQMCKGGGQSVVVINGEMFLLGGMNMGARASRDVFRFCPVVQAWHGVAPMRKPRAHFGCWVLPNNDILVAGGHSDDFVELCSAEIYDSENGAWIDGPYLPSEITRYDCATWRGRLLVTEGWHWPFHFSPRGFVLDLRGMSWDSIGTELCEGWMGPSFVWEDCLMAVVDSQPGKYLISKFHPDVERWQILSDSQVPPGMHPPWRVAVHKDQVYLVGKGLAVTVATVTRSASGEPVLTWSKPTQHSLFKGSTCNLCAVALL